MPLRDILLDIEKDSGQTLSSDETNIRIIDINNAARELHAAVDLPEACDELVVSINTATQQIVFPAIIDRVLGMRYVDTRLAIDVDALANRYNYWNTGEHEVWYLQWRDRGLSPLEREINNQSVLRFSLPPTLKNSVVFSITITGRTDKSTRISETLNFTLDDTEKVTFNNWKSVESIVKSILTDYDILVYDADGNLLATLPNSEYQSLYRNFQLFDTDSFTPPTNQSGVEVWYKKKFMPFKNDQDTYFGTDRYDKAIYWKYMEIRSKNVDNAVAYQAKFRQVVVDLMSDFQKTVKRKLNFAPVSYYNLPYASYNAFHTLR